MNLGENKKTAWIFALIITALLVAFVPAWANESAFETDGRGAVFTNPVIYDISGNQVYELNRGDLMEIHFTTAEVVAISGIAVTKPDGSPDDVLRELSVKTGQNGYVLTSGEGRTSIVAYYRPELRGKYVFAIYYYEESLLPYIQQFSVESTGYDGGSSGCNAGAGMAAFFALAGLAAAGKLAGRGARR